MISKILNYYVKVIKLETGFKTKNKYLLLSLLILSIITVVFRDVIINNYIENQFIVNTLYLLIIFNIIYYQFLIAIRLTLILLKGLPFFYKEIKRGSNYKIYLLLYVL